METLVKLVNINKTYKDKGALIQPVLKNITLDVATGDMTAIMGTSGSGKTTLLNILGLIDSYDSGSYFFDGEDVSKIKEAKLTSLRNAKIGFIFQDFCLLNNETAVFNVMLPMLFNNTAFSKIKPKAIEALKRVALPEEQYHKKVKFLSGGQKQRVAIARAILNSPKILLADEPTGSIDAEGTKQILTLFQELNRTGQTILLVTHDKNVAETCKKIIYIEDGRSKYGDAGNSGAITPESP